jgi:hypothetical protein
MHPLRLTLGAALALATLAVTAETRQADEPQMQRLALCQDSWFDWRDDEVRMVRFASFFESRFNASPQGDGAYLPKAPVQVLGQAVTQVYPQSVGMGVGFSVALRADLAQARAAIENQLGKPMACAKGDGMQSCELKVGTKKTVVLMAPLNGPAKTSLIGCYYFYQQ